MTEIYVLAFLVSQTFLLLRCEWVSDQRIDVLRFYSQEAYDALPGFDVMVMKCWIWDIDTFVHGGKKQ